MYHPDIKSIMKHIALHSDRHYREKPGYTLMVVAAGNHMLEMFFEKREDRTDFFKKYKREKGKFPHYQMTVDIPVKTHKYEKDNKTIEHRVNEHVSVCPNDNETKLEACGDVVLKDDGSYIDMAKCLDCGYIVFRKPLKERVEELVVQE